MEHTWVTEYIDGGHIDGDFWVCRHCGAAGGPVFDNNPPTFPPFYADGSGLQVSTDCNKAKQQIKTHLNAGIVQSVEHQVSNLNVVGSSPTARLHTTKENKMTDREVLTTRVYPSYRDEIYRGIRYVLNRIADICFYNPMNWLTTAVTGNTFE